MRRGDRCLKGESGPWWRRCQTVCGEQRDDEVRGEGSGL